MNPSAPVTCMQIVTARSAASPAWASASRPGESRLSRVRPSTSVAASASICCTGSSADSGPPNARRERACSSASRSASSDMPARYPVDAATHAAILAPDSSRAGGAPGATTPTPRASVYGIARTARSRLRAGDRAAARRGRRPHSRSAQRPHPQRTSEQAVDVGGARRTRGPVPHRRGRRGREGPDRCRAPPSPPPSAPPPMPDSRRRPLRPASRDRPPRAGERLPRRSPRTGPPRPPAAS